MDKKEKIKICAYCNIEFECKANDITNCQCQGIVLSFTVSCFIKEKYKDCLCINCLKTFAKNAESKKIDS